MNCTVRTEVCKYNRITIFYHTISITYKWNNEFICFTISIRCFNTSNWIFEIFTLTNCHCIKCNLNTVIVLISIHTIISTTNCSNFYITFSHNL